MNARTRATAVACVLACCAAWGQQNQLLVEGAHYAMTQLPAMQFRAEGYDYDHEVLVAVPATYDALPDKRYPVLWVMDGALLFDMTVGLAGFYAAGNRIPELIVVAVGHPSEEGLAGREEMAQWGVDPDADIFANVKGDAFLAFLIDQLRPALAERYRMADDHALLGHSAGGAFTGYALLGRPGGFDRYIIGSGTNGLSLTLEAEYAAGHDDLPARVFVGAGDLEVNNLPMSAQRIVSRTVLFAENLLLRRYPSLALQTRLYRDRDHFDVLPIIIGDGLKWVYADAAAELEPPLY